MTDEAKALVERLRDGKRRHLSAHILIDSIEASDLIETQAREIDRLRDLLVRGYVVCDGDDEDAVAFRNDAHAALAGGSHE